MKWYRTLAVGVGATFGTMVGVGGYTFHYAKGSAYLTNDPKACNNCHIMNDQFNGWAKSSHRSVATCNDCHTPPGLIPKYLVKASNGFWHSYAFTTGDFHEPIRIKPSNLEVTEKACRKCHADVVHEMDTVSGRGPASCVHCHQSVGHLH